MKNKKEIEEDTERDRKRQKGIQRDKKIHEETEKNR